MYLVVYVDDFCASGTEAALKKAWSEIQKRLVLDEPEGMTHFLGCKRTMFESNDGKRGIEHDMKDFWLTAVKAYKELAPHNADGSLINLKKVDTPYMSEHDGEGISRARVKISDDESWTQCMYCGYSGTSDCFLKGGPGQQPMGVAACNRQLADVLGLKWAQEERAGALEKSASSIVMRLLYGARMCRYDMLFAIQRLASRFTKWTALQDDQLYHLMSYVETTAEDFLC